jgi:hypothetical protein
MRWMRKYKKEQNPIIPGTNFSISLFYWVIYSSKLSIIVFQKINICIQEEN